MDDEIDLWEAGFILRKNWFIILVIFVLIFSATLFYTFNMEPEYRATSVVVISQNDQTSSLLVNEPKKVVDIETQVEIIKSAAVLSPVKKNITNDFSLDVIPLKDSTIIELHVEAKDPTLTADAANAVAVSYIDYNLRVKRGQAQEIISLLYHQINSSQNELNRLNRRLLDVEEKKEPTLDEELAIVNLENEIALVAQDYNYYLGRQRAMNEVLERPDPIDPVEKRLLDIEKGSAKDILEAAQIELVTLNGRLSTLNRKLLELKLDEKLTTEEEVYYLDLLQTISVKEQQLNDLLERREEMNIVASQSKGNVELLTAASIPTKPIRPNVVINGIIGVLVSLVVACGLVYLRELLRGTVKRPVDAEKALKTRIIGDLPRVRVRKKGYDSYVVQHKSRQSVFAEKMRILRTNIMFYAQDNKARVVQITSPQNGDGKSMIAVNLALSLAHNKKKVLLVDANLRQPLHHKVFQKRKERPHTGLTQAITGAPLQKVITETNLDNLDLLYAGQNNSYPGELFGSEKMKEIIKELKKMHYDLVLIDSPSVEFSESSILASLSDGVIFVLAHDKTKYKAAKRAAKSLSKAKVVGAVYNLT